MDHSLLEHWESMKGYYPNSLWHAHSWASHEAQQILFQVDPQEKYLNKARLFLLSISSLPLTQYLQASLWILTVPKESLLLHISKELFQLLTTSGAGLLPSTWVHGKHLEWPQCLFLLSINIVSEFFSNLPYKMIPLSIRIGIERCNVYPSFALNQLIVGILDR